jgi:acyl-CoA synthetase (NDP forming)
MLRRDLKNNKKTALSDRDAKQLLDKFEIAMVPARFVGRQIDVSAAACQLGFPVVLKGTGPNLLHKTDRGLVHLNLLDANAVENAVQKIVAEAGAELEGFIVQPQVSGQREFVAGLFRDNQFGPIIMFGVGVC